MISTRRLVRKQSTSRLLVNIVCNDNGHRLINFCASHNLVVGSSLFPHKRIQLGTWTSPDGNIVNQIDHFQISARHRLNLLDVRTVHEANMDLDHFLTLAKVTARISIVKTRRGQRFWKFNLQKRKEPEVSQAYVSKINEKFSNVSSIEEKGVDEMWLDIENIIRDAAEEVIGPIQVQKRSSWFDEECSQATLHKNEAYTLML